MSWWWAALGLACFLSTPLVIFWCFKFGAFGWLSGKRRFREVYGRKRKPRADEHLYN